MSEVKNPYNPNDTRHGAFERGVEAASAPKAPQPDVVVAMCGRSSAKSMIEMQIQRLRHQIEGLESLAKLAVVVDGTPADEALWHMIVNQRA